MTVDWSRKYENLTIRVSGSQGNYMAAIAGISYEKGLEFVQIQHDAVDRTDFVEFLQELKARQGRRKVAVFLDNLSVHHTLQVKDECIRLDIPLVFNCAYEPNYQPIESVFSIVKNNYKRAKVAFEVNDEDYDQGEIIDQAFRSIPKQAV